MAPTVITDLRALRRALEGGASVEKVVWCRGESPPSPLWRLIKRYRIPFQQVPISVIPQGKKWAAYLSPISLFDLSTWLGEEPQGVAVGLLGVSDVRNVGAILRSAAAFGVRWVLLRAGGSPLLSSAALWRSSAGAIPHLHIVREARPYEALKQLRQKGWQLIATVPPSLGGMPYTSWGWQQPSLLLFGEEEKGLPPEYIQLCDLRLSIPHEKAVESLNVSVAAGILLSTAYMRNKPST
ncbi:MAG: RNA methyltransferase [Bacteroidia bacterium]|nr:RNA methyltransferase [Bacteroidia bacterium]